MANEQSGINIKNHGKQLPREGPQEILFSDCINNLRKAKEWSVIQGGIASKLHHITLQSGSQGLLPALSISETFLWQCSTKNYLVGNSIDSIHIPL